MEECANLFHNLPDEITAAMLEYLAHDPAPKPEAVALVDKNMLKIFNKYRNLFKPKLKVGQIESFKEAIRIINSKVELSPSQKRSELRQCFEQFSFPHYLTEAFSKKCRRCKKPTKGIIDLPRKRVNGYSIRRIVWCSHNNALLLYEFSATYTPLPYAHREREEIYSNYTLLTLNEVVWTIVPE